MANNYYKFYKFLQLLKTNSDENHILTAKYIQEQLVAITGDKIDRRTIYEYTRRTKVRQEPLRCNSKWGISPTMVTGTTRSL